MDQAVPLLKEAADQGHMLAQKCCGELHSYGHGVAEDDQLGFVYTERAAQQGHTECQYVTAVRYCTGIGVGQDYEAGREFFRLAAAQGDKDAIEALQELDAKLYADKPAVKKKKAKPNAPCSCGSGKKYKKCCGANKK